MAGLKIRLDDLTVPHLIFDTNGIIIEANQLAYDLLGYDSDLNEPPHLKR